MALITLCLSTVLWNQASIHARTLGGEGGVIRSGIGGSLLERRRRALSRLPCCSFGSSAVLSWWYRRSALYRKHLAAKTPHH